jgi:D-aspartate ligase
VPEPGGSGGHNGAVVTDQDLAARLDPWVRALPADVVPAVVLGGSVNALSHTRSLGRRGIPVLIVDHERRLATYTRYATPIILDTDADHLEGWLDALRRVGRRLPGPAVLLPTADELVSLVADHADELSAWYRFLVPAAADVAAIVDKSSQYARAAAAGISVPETRTPTSIEEVTAIADEVPYPVLLKPRGDESRRAFGHKARPVDSAAELVALFKEHDAPGVRFLVQELVPGPDDELYGYWAFWDVDGHEHSWMTRRKVRQYPLGFGTGACQESVSAPEVAERSRQLLQAFNYRGLVGVEWKRDSRDGRIRLMEINPRTVIGNQLAISSGIDLPWIAYRALADPATSLPPNHDFKVGVRWVNEDLDPKAFRDLRRAGRITTWGWVRSLLGTRSWALWSWRDPRPALQRTATMPWGIVRRAAEVAGRLRPGSRAGAVRGGPRGQ